MTWLARLARRFGLARGLALALAHRARRAAHRRSAADPGTARSRLRLLPGAASARGDAAAGGDRRHRREEPQDASASGRGRARAIADLMTRLTQMGALVDRFRRRFPRARPHVARDRGRRVPQSRRRDADKLRALPSNDDVFADAHAPFACRARRVRRAVRAARNRRSAPPPVGIATLGGNPRPYLFEFPRSVAQRAGARAGRAAAAVCSPSAPSAMASCGACRW